MENARHIASLGEDQFEEWFLAGVANEAMPVDDMLGALRELRLAGMNEQADSWAELMEEALAERGRTDDVIRVLRMRADWHASDTGFRAYCDKKISWLYRNDPLRKKFTAGMGITKGVPIQECFRRLNVLQRLAPGVLCLDNTWGVGAVKNVDAFYERVTIDFDKKRGHEMSFAYAAEALQFVNEEHLLARKYKDAAALLALAESQPAEVVRMALRSYGPLPVSRLQEIISDGIVKPEAWKPFWESARKALKGDPLVAIPSKRTEPITLLDKEMTCDAAWFAGLATLRTPEGILACLDELEERLTSQELDDPGRHTVGERLAFLMLGFGDKDVGLRVQITLAACKWNIPAAQVDWAGEVPRFLIPERFLAAASAISSRRLEEFLRFLVKQDRTKTVEALTASLPMMTLNVLNTCMAFLLEEGAESACAAVFKELVGMRKAGVEALFWLAKRPDRMAAWGLGTLGDLAFQILPALELTYNFERLKAANQLAELVQQKTWIEAAVDSMNTVQRSSFVRSLRAVMGRIPADAQTMIGRIVIRYPELAGLLVEKKDEQSEGQVAVGFSSWRSVRKKQQQLEKLVNEDIPKNSRDIGVARSYGDLRENFEYKAAKEQQGILLRRREELEQGLKDIQGTDFSTFQTDVAGMGTSVGIRLADGSTQRYYILGEWDQDTELGIISCGSRMGKALMGHLVGEEVQVPSEAGEVACRVVEVGALPEVIRDWAKAV
jgi:transcription elongation GreA/GreB family factor